MLEDGILRLHPEKSLDQGMREQLPLQWVPVPWGDRMYLLEEKDIPLFAKYVNQGWEPRSEEHGLFLLRQQDWKKKVSGPPGLPQLPLCRTLLRIGSVEWRASPVLHEPDRCPGAGSC